MDSAPQLFDPRDAYFRSDAMSCSTACALLDSVPAQIRYDLDNPQESTKAMDFGKLAHRSVLEGQDLRHSHFIVPDNFTRAHHKKWARLIAEIDESGLPELKQSDFAQIEAMRAKILEHELAPLLFKTGTPETPHYWRCGRTGMDCKALFDYRPDGVIFGDYKTVHSLDNDALKRAVANLHWAHRAWWYMDGIRDLTGVDKPQYVFVCQDKRPPYLVRVAVLQAEDIKRAGYEMLAKRQLWQDCRESGHYPQWGEYGGICNVETIGLPAYEAKRLEMSAEELAGFYELNAPIEEQEA